MSVSAARFPAAPDQVDAIFRHQDLRVLAGQKGADLEE